MTNAHPSTINWRRGLAEVGLIFVGITLALLFDNWNEARKDRILEEQLFAALRADLLESRADLVSDIESAEQRAINSKNLIEAIASPVPPDNAGRNLMWRQIGTTRLYKKDFAYRALVAQGLDSISNWHILQAATNLYELQFSRVAAAENSAMSLEQRFLEQLFPHMLVPRQTIDAFGPRETARPFLQTASLEVADWDALHEDREMLHWLMEILERTHAAGEWYGQALSQLDMIVDMIDEEIGPADP